MGKKYNRNSTSPEPVQSNGINTTIGAAAVSFNEREYQILRARYLQPRIRTNAVLAGGMTLRRQTKSRIIDNHHKGLAAKIDSLDKKGRREEIYAMLISLKEWDLDPKKVPHFMRILPNSGRKKRNKINEGEYDEDSVDDCAVYEFVDLSKEEVVTRFIDLEYKEDGSNSCDEFEWDEHTAFPEYVHSRDVLNSATTSVHENNAEHQECIPRGENVLTASTTSDEVFFQVTHVACREMWLFASKIEMYLSNRMFYKKKGSPCSSGRRGASVGGINRSSCSSSSAMSEKSWGSSKHVAKKEVNAKEQFVNSSDLQTDGDECTRVAQNQVILKSRCFSRSIEHQQKPVESQSTPLSAIISKESGNPGIVDFSHEENHTADEMSRNKCQSSSYLFDKVEVDPAAVVATAKNSLPRVCETITNDAISGTVCKPGTTLFSEGPNLLNSVVMSISDSLPDELSELVAKTRTNPSQNTLISMNNIVPLDNALIDLTGDHSESCKSNDESTGNSFGDCTSVQIQEAVDGMMTFHESFDQARYPASTPMKFTHMNEGHHIHNMDRAPSLATYDRNYAVTKPCDITSVDDEGYKCDEEEYGNDDFVDCKCDNVMTSDENLNKGLALSSTVYAADINSERLFDSMHTPLPSTSIVSVGFKACQENVQKTEETRRMQPTSLNERFQIASFISRSTELSPTVVNPNGHEISYSTSYENFPEDGNGIENEGEFSEHLQSTTGLKSVAKHMQQMCLNIQSKGYGQGKSEEYTPRDRPQKKKHELNILPAKKITSYFGVARRNPTQMQSHDIEVSSISIGSQRLNTQNTTNAASAAAQNRQQMAKPAEASKNQKWLIRYKQLKEYRDKHGHCSVPVAWLCNPTLGTWVSAQRYQYKLNHDGKKSCLTRERINLLNQLGFVWRAKSGRREDHIPRNESSRTQKDMSNKNDEAQSKNIKCAHRYNILSTERMEVKRNPPNRSLTIQSKIMEDHSIAPSVALVQSGYSHYSSKEKGRNSSFVPIIGEMGATLEELPKTPFQTPQYDTRYDSPKEYSNNISKVNPFSPTSSETSNTRNQELTVSDPLKHIRQQVMKCNTETTQFLKVCQVDRKSNALNQRDPILIQPNSATQRSDFLQNIKGSNGVFQMDPDSDITLEVKSPDCGKILKQDTALVPLDGYLSEASRVRCFAPSEIKNERHISNPTIVKPQTKKRNKRRSHKRAKLRLKVIEFGFPPTVNHSKNHSKKKSRRLEVMCTERPTRALIPQVPVVVSKAKIKPPSQRFQSIRNKTNLAQFPAIGCVMHQLSRVDTTKNFPIVPPYRINKRSAQLCLANEWRKQSKKRRKGDWLPSGGWRPPHWAPPLQDKRGLYLTNHENKEEKRSVALKQFGCRKTLLPRLDGLMNNFTAMFVKERINITVGNRPDGNDRPKYLSEVKYPEYLNPTVQVLKTAHLMIQDLLPKGDCECFEVIKIARSYYDYWRPAHGKTKVIVLAESHAFTERNRALKGPGLESSLLRDTYFGPREFISLVYCLAYGENEALSRECNDPNKGTPQFWALLAACSRGVDFVPDMAISAKTKNVRAQFATDVLKGGGLPVNDRLEAKVKILKDLQTRGIWLLDASLFGWYISQPQEYNRSVKTNEIHRKAKARPPKDLKAPSLVLSWELFTKHVIRDIANEGGLKLLIPIGMEVEASLTRGRLEDAISTEPEASVAETFPAPNAWIPGGYGPFHAKLAALIHEVAPRILEDEK